MGDTNTQRAIRRVFRIRRRNFSGRSNDEQWILMFKFLESAIREVCTWYSPFRWFSLFFPVYSLSSDPPPLHRPRGNSIPVYTPRVRHALNHFPSLLAYVFVSENVYIKSQSNPIIDYEIFKEDMIIKRGDESVRALVN